MIRHLLVAAINAIASLADKAVCAWPNLTHEEDES